MQVSDIQSRVKRMFGDESGVQITDTDIVQWINDGQKQIVSVNEGLLEEIATTDAIQGQSEYDLKTLFSSLLVLRSIMYKGSLDQSYFKLKGYSFNEFNELVDGWNGDQSTIGSPVQYTIYKDRLFLFPVPDTSILAAIKIFYNRKPVDVTTGTDIPDLPELYHTSLVDYCLMRAYELDEDFQAASAKGQQVATDLQVLRGRDDWKSQETYPMITVRWEDM